MLLNNPWIKVQLIRDIRKYLELNDNKNTTCQNLCDASKMALGEKFITLKAYIKSKINI